MKKFLLIFAAAMLLITASCQKDVLESTKLGPTSVSSKSNMIEFTVTQEMIDTFNSIQPSSHVSLKSVVDEIDCSSDWIYLCQPVGINYPIVVSEYVVSALSQSGLLQSDFPSTSNWKLYPSNEGPIKYSGYNTNSFIQISTPLNISVGQSGNFYLNNIDYLRLYEPSDRTTSRTSNIVMSFEYNQIVYTKTVDQIVWAACSSTNISISWHFDVYDELCSGTFEIRVNGDQKVYTSTNGSTGTLDLSVNDLVQATVTSDCFETNLTGELNDVQNYDGLAFDQDYAGIDWDNGQINGWVLGRLLLPF